MDRVVSNTNAYWCHQCTREIRPNLPQLVCPTCGGDFIEEIEESPTPQTTTIPTTIQNQPNHFTLFGNIQNNQQFQQNSQNQINNQQQTGQTFPSININTTQYTNPMTGIMQQISQLLEQNIHFNSTTPTPNTVIFQASFGTQHGSPLSNIFHGFGPTLAGNPGDYLFGPSMEQFLNHLFETARYHGPPPASKEVVKKLKVVKIEADKVGESTDCAVCKEEFAVDEEALELFCKHLFHKDCIMPWLEMRNSCPVCRFELPTDDPDYEQLRQRRQQQQNRTTSNSTTSSSSSSPSPSRNSDSNNH
jgi:E3 ubiquitin-protein ligase RNF115/126